LRERWDNQYDYTPYQFGSVEYVGYLQDLVDRNFDSVFTAVFALNVWLHSGTVSALGNGRERTKWSSDSPE